MFPPTETTNELELGKTSLDCVVHCNDVEVVTALFTKHSIPSIKIFGAPILRLFPVSVTISFP